MLEITKALEKIKEFHNKTKDGEHTRYKSWEHCHKAFLNYRNDTTKYELLSLHLYTYLASWGMLRNSFLLNHDYLVHLPLVKTLLSGKYEKLFTEQNEKYILLVMQAKKDVEKGYSKNYPTETLITKILLGIFGCTPAYDKYFKGATRKYNVSSGLFNETSLNKLWLYYNKHKTQFESLNMPQYTPMKLLDMCLFQIGMDENL
jgi:hypothetical protein